MFIRDYSEYDIPNEDVNTSLGKVQNFFISAAKRSLKIRIRKNQTIVIKNVAKHELRKILKWYYDEDRIFPI